MRRLNIYRKKSVSHVVSLISCSSSSSVSAGCNGASPLRASKRSRSVSCIHLRIANLFKLTAAIGTFNPMIAFGGFSKLFQLLFGYATSGVRVLHPIALADFDPRAGDDHR